MMSCLIFRSKEFINRYLRPLGYEMHKTRNESKDWEWLKDYSIATVLDVGANEGQFARKLLGVLPHATIYAFEPLRDCYQRLCKQFTGVANLKAFNCALGDVDGETVINKDTFAPSSSLLPMTFTHKEAFPYTGESSHEKISIRTLNGLLPELTLMPEILLKIDVQGFEDKVLQGMAGVLPKMRIIIVETSFVELYEGQMLFDGLYEKLRATGFRFIGAFDPVRDPRNGKILQADSVFLQDRHK